MLGQPHHTVDFMLTLLSGLCGWGLQAPEEDGEEERGGALSSVLLSYVEVRATVELSSRLHHLGLPSGTWQPPWLISIFTAKGQLTGCSLQIFKLLD